MWIFKRVWPLLILLSPMPIVLGAVAKNYLNVLNPYLEIPDQKVAQIILRNSSKILMGVKDYQLLFAEENLPSGPQITMNTLRMHILGTKVFNLVFSILDPSGQVVHVVKENQVSQGDLILASARALIRLFFGRVSYQQQQMLEQMRLSTENLAYRRHLRQKFPQLALAPLYHPSGEIVSEEEEVVTLPPPDESEQGRPPTPKGQDAEEAESVSAASAVEEEARPEEMSAPQGPPAKWEIKFSKRGMVYQLGVAGIKKQILLQDLVRAQNSFSFWGPIGAINYAFFDQELVCRLQAGWLSAQSTGEYKIPANWQFDFQFRWQAPQNILGLMLGFSGENLAFISIERLNSQPLVGEMNLLAPSGGMGAKWQYQQWWMGVDLLYRHLLITNLEYGEKTNKMGLAGQTLGLIGQFVYQNRYQLSLGMERQWLKSGIFPDFVFENTQYRWSLAYWF